MLAYREAVKAARAEEAVSTDITLNFPVTAERVRMSCPDAFTRRVVGAEAAAGYAVKTSH